MIKHDAINQGGGDKDTPKSVGWIFAAANLVVTPLARPASILFGAICCRFTERQFKILTERAIHLHEETHSSMIKQRTTSQDNLSLSHDSKQNPSNGNSKNLGKMLPTANSKFASKLSRPTSKDFHKAYLRNTLASPSMSISIDAQSSAKIKPLINWYFHYVTNVVLATGILLSVINGEILFESVLRGIYMYTKWNKFSIVHLVYTFFFSCKKSKLRLRNYVKFLYFG